MMQFSHTWLSSTSSQLLAVLAAVFVTFVWFIVSSVRSSFRLSHIPGPSTAHFSKWWMIRATASGEMPFRLAEVCREYGSLARIGPNDLVTDDADTLRMINGLRSPYLRSDWYSATAFSHETNHAFCEKNDELHADRRTKLIPGYSGREIEGLETAMDARINDLCNLIKTKYLSDHSAFRPVDLCRICSYFTLDVIHTLAFGTPMGFLEQDQDVYGYLENQRSMLPIFEWLSTLPFLEKLLRFPPFSKLAMPRKTDPTGVGLLQSFAENAIRRRREEKHYDMLASFLDHGLTDQEAEQEAVLQVIAGSDTTATTIRMILFLIMTHPSVYLQLSSELGLAEREVDGLSTPISDRQAQSLPYLSACIKEGLRMWPPVVGLMSKVVPPDGGIIMGKSIPGGTCIGYSAFSLLRKESVFGADAQTFRPARWLPEFNDNKTNEEAVADMEKHLDLVFGYGKNACLGKPIAQMEMRKTIAEVLRRFDVSIVRPEKPFRSVNRNGLFVQSDMLVKFEARVGLAGGPSVGKVSA